MTREWQVIYREVGGESGRMPSPIGPALTALVMVEGADQARAQFQAAGFYVVGVNFVRNVVDWDKPNFDREEAAAFLCRETPTLATKLGEGLIPVVRNGRPVFPRRWLERYLEEHAEGPDALLRKCKAA